MKLKKKILLNLILILLVSLIFEGSTYATSLFDNVTVRSTNVFTMETLGVSVGDKFTVDRITYNITDTTNNYVSISSSADIRGDVTLSNIVYYEGIPYTVTAIGAGAFRRCGSLTSIKIPEEVTIIGNGAFEDCLSLQTINLPESLKTIHVWAFNGCISLVEITIPKSVSYIGDTFTRCNNLIAINVDENNLYYSSENGVLFNKNKTTIVKYPPGKASTNYTIPSTVTTIGQDAFTYSNKLEEITIPERITIIPKDAFAQSIGLKKVVIPETVTSIGEYAFCRMHKFNRNNNSKISN